MVRENNVDETFLASADKKKNIFVVFFFKCDQQPWDFFLPKYHLATNHYAVATKCSFVLTNEHFICIFLVRTGYLDCGPRFISPSSHQTWATIARRSSPDWLLIYTRFRYCSNLSHWLKGCCCFTCALPYNISSSLAFCPTNLCARRRGLHRSAVTFQYSHGRSWRTAGWTGRAIYGANPPLLPLPVFLFFSGVSPLPQSGGQSQPARGERRRPIAGQLQRVQLLVKSAWTAATPGGAFQQNTQRGNHDRGG